MDNKEIPIAQTEALSIEQDEANSAATAQAAEEERLKKLHDNDFLSELLLKRRRLSSDDLKVLVTFAEHFGLRFNVQENLGKIGWCDGRRGLVVSVSPPGF